jgi:hypothetical protein
MDSLFKMAVETLFLHGNSFEEFQKLPEQLKLDIIPFVLEKLKQIDQIQHQENIRLQEHIKSLTNENIRLHNLIASLKNYNNIYPKPKPRF